VFDSVSGAADRRDGPFFKRINIMAENSGIAWTNHTFNPWWGCVKTSAGCKFCYAEKQISIFSENFWGENSNRKFFFDRHWKDPEKWNRAAKKAGRIDRVFCGSMCDVMEDRDDLIEPRKRLFNLIEKTENLNWLLLTKRPENFSKFLPEAWLKNPRPNVWLMTTVENSDVLYRIGELAKVPAVVHGLSMEPLISRVADLPWQFAMHPEINWVIAGGESGENARPFNIDWARTILNDCKMFNVACFIKQMGSNPVNSEGLVFKSKKGEDMNEWPDDLKIREFPK
jgi:protein gp37